MSETNSGAGLPVNPSASDVLNMIRSLHQELQETKGQLEDAKSQLEATQNQVAASQAQMSSGYPKPKLNKPPLFTGKLNVDSWASHMNIYLRGSTDEEALHVAVSYLGGAAHKWWMTQSTTISTWTDLRDAICKRFSHLNKTKMARDRLHKWRQIKDIKTYNDDFLAIIIDIPNISMEEQIDKYERGLKAYIWKEICTREYSELAEIMKDAERVEAAFQSRIIRGATIGKRDDRRKEEPIPMEIGKIEIKKLTTEERQKCIKEGLCLRCREPGHIAKKCPKGKRN